jgi:DNA polymerase
MPDSDAGEKKRSQQLEQLHRRVRRCRKCVLWKTRDTTVPGEGPAGARLMLVGEAPGRKEDESGRPFVGPSGKFLDELLADNGLNREDTFITSVVKCRPNGGGKPSQASVDACTPYLERQLELVGPRIVVALGQVAAKTLLDADKVGEVRGKMMDADRRHVLVTYHPAAGRRFPEMRRAMKTDFRLLARRIKESD